MAKKIQSYVKLHIAAGSANPSPPIGPVLGQKGINIVEFCKIFNTKTQNLEKGLLIPVVVTIFSDRSFSFITKAPPVSILLKKAAGIKSGSNNPNKNNKIGTITSNQIYEIAKIKSPDMTGSSIEAIARSIVGTAHSIGLIVEN